MSDVAVLDKVIPAQFSEKSEIYMGVKNLKQSIEFVLGCDIDLPPTIVNPLSNVYQILNGIKFNPEQQE
jgi:hypothetical protein